MSAMTLSPNLPIAGNIAADAAAPAINKPASGKLNPSKVQSGMAATMAASYLLQLYTNVTLATPIIQLPSEVDTATKTNVSSELSKHQAMAQEHAKYYLNTVNPLIVGTLADILGFSNQWSAFYDKLLTLAHVIDEHDNKAMFTEAMRLFQKAIQEKADATRPVIDALNTLLVDIQADQRNLTADHGAVEAWLSGESGEIAELKKTLKADQDAINKDNAMIAGGAVIMIVGILTTIVGVLAEFETFGAAAGVVVAGLVVTAGGAAMTGIAAKDLESKQKQLKSKTIELSQDQTLYTLVIGFDHAIESILRALQAAVSAVEELQHGWHSLHDDIGEIIGALSLADPTMPSWLSTQLNAADSDWQDCHLLAAHLQENGTLQVTKMTM